MVDGELVSILGVEIQHQSFINCLICGGVLHYVHTYYSVYSVHSRSF